MRNNKIKTSKHAIELGKWYLISNKKYPFNKTSKINNAIKVLYVLLTSDKSSILVSFFEASTKLR